MGVSGAMETAVISTLTFPDFASGNTGSGGGGGGGGSGNENDNEKSGGRTLGAMPVNALQKVLNGVLINSLSNLRLNLVQEPRSLLVSDERGGAVEVEVGSEFRVQGIAHWALGRDEKVLVSGRALEAVSPVDPHFTRVKDLEWVDLVVDVGFGVGEGGAGDGDGDGGVGGVGGGEEWEVDFGTDDEAGNGTFAGLWEEMEKTFQRLFGDSGIEGEVLEDDNMSSQPSIAATEVPAHHTQPSFTRYVIPAILPTGAGAAPIPASMERADTVTVPLGSLRHHKIFFLDSTLCTSTLPNSIAKTHTILVLRRGGCSFNDKLSNLPSFIPTATSLQLVIVLDDQQDASDASRGAATAALVRPLLDTKQTMPSGLERRHPIAMVLVDGRSETEMVFRGMASAVGSLDAATGKVVMQKRRGGDGDGGGGADGLAVKRRYWFESMGVPIGNLIVV